jgi:hypothetical protein
VANKENVVAPTVNTAKDVKNPIKGVQPRDIVNPGTVLPR